MYRSKILYRALMQQENIPTSALVPFQKQGIHLLVIGEQEDGALPTMEEQVEQLQDIDQELNKVFRRLQNISSYESSSKAIRLQCVSDMYNGIGLSRLQAEALGLKGGVWELARRQYGHSYDRDEQLFAEIGEFLLPYLPQHTKLNLDGAGAFLGDENKIAGAKKGRPSEEQKALWNAKRDFEQCMRLHGVFQGIVDFCDAILGVRVVQDEHAKQEGWNKNVRLLHLYKKGKDSV